VSDEFDWHWAYLLLFFRRFVRTVAEVVKVGAAHYGPAVDL